jgi:small-conductance mechanosensitive channel
MSFLSLLQRAVMRLSLAFVLLLALVPVAWAQIPGLPAKAEAAAAAPAEPATIPIADISLRADEDGVFLQDVVRRSGSSVKLDALKQELEFIRRNVDVTQKRAPEDGLDDLPLTNLETLERYLGFVERELRKWQAQLQAVSRPVSADAAAIVQKRKRWLDTQQAIAGDAMPALSQRIDTLLTEFAQAERVVSQPLAQLLALGREGNALQARVNAISAGVRLQIATIDRKLWQRDADNLFTALGQTHLRKSLDLSTFMQELRTEVDFMDEFDRGSRNVHNGVLVLALLMLPVFVTLSARAKKAFPDDAGLARHRKALTRPLSAWLLLSLATLILIHFFGPATRIKVLMMLAWLPIMRLRPELLRSLFGRGIYFTGVFIALAALSQMITSMSLIFRLVVLLNALSMLAVLGWMLLRLVRGQRQRDSRALRGLRNMIAAGTVALVAAVVANLIGNVTLSAMLTEATLISAYIGLFLLAAGNVIRGWLRFVFRPTTQRMQAGNVHAGRLLQVMASLFDIALFLIWVGGTLDAFRVLRPLRDWLSALFDFSFGLGNISMTVGGIALFGVSVLLSFWIAKTVRGVLAEDVLPRMTLPRGVANSASTMTYYVLLLLGLMVALGAAGFELSQVTIVLGALSVGIGFGLQTVVNNFVSGLILMFERPIQPGDTVELSGTVGTIRDIGMRATTFTTFEGADVVVPNGMLLSEKLINWTLSTNTRRIDIPVGVAYGSDPAPVRDLLLQVALATKGVATHPPPTVLFTGFGASSLDFSVRAWAGFDDHIVVRSDMAVAIHAALDAAGIAIPFPQQDLHLKSVEPELFRQMRKDDPT